MSLRKLPKLQKIDQLKQVKTCYIVKGELHLENQRTVKAGLFLDLNFAIQRTSFFYWPPNNFCLFGFHVMLVSNVLIWVPYLLWFGVQFPHSHVNLVTSMTYPLDLWSFKNSAAESPDSPGHVSIRVRTNISD